MGEKTNEFILNCGLSPLEHTKNIYRTTYFTWEEGPSLSALSKWCIQDPRHVRAYLTSEHYLSHSVPEPLRGDLSITIKQYIPSASFIQGTMEHDRYTSGICWHYKHGLTHSPHHLLRTEWVRAFTLFWSALYPSYKKLQAFTGLNISCVNSSPLKAWYSPHPLLPAICHYWNVLPLTQLVRAKQFRQWTHLVHHQSSLCAGTSWWRPSMTHFKSHPVEVSWRLPNGLSM